MRLSCMDLLLAVAYAGIGLAMIRHVQRSIALGYIVNSDDDDPPRSGSAAFKFNVYFELAVAVGLFALAALQLAVGDPFSYFGFGYPRDI